MCRRDVDHSKRKLECAHEHTQTHTQTHSITMSATASESEIASPAAKVVLDCSQFCGFVGLYCGFPATVVALVFGVCAISGQCAGYESPHVGQGVLLIFLSMIAAVAVAIAGFVVGCVVGCVLVGLGALVALVAFAIGCAISCLVELIALCVRLHMHTRASPPPHPESATVGGTREAAAIELVVVVVVGKPVTHVVGTPFIPFTTAELMV